ELQVDPFACGIRGKQVAGTTCGGRLAEKLYLLLPLLVIHATVELGDFASKAETFEPSCQECKCVPMLSEDDDFLVLVARILKDLSELFELRLFTQVIDPLCQLQ